jgi:release factor glutamine methyltransferase
MNQLHKYQVRKLYYKLVNLNISLQKADVYQILEHLTKIEYSKLSESFDTFVEIDEKELQSITVQVEQDVPVSYILKYKYFYKRKYYVDRRVLIPRSDTEIIVETSLK